MVFLAKTSNSVYWKVVVDAIATLVEEATFEVNPSALSFRAMDPSHVALIDLYWPNTAFDNFECDKDVKFSVRISDFKKLMDRAGSKDTIEISMKDESSLIVRIISDYSSEFSIHLIESTYGPTPLPKLSFNAKAIIDLKTFRKILEDISTLADHVTISATKEKIVFSGKSDTGNVAVELISSSPALKLLEIKEDSKATYNVNYLTSISRAAKDISETISYEFSNKMPLRLQFQLTEQGGNISFYLAPRIEER
ncbi:MAG: proliferating cell nuclear antigen (pcna) [Nitrososphaerales archaeon]